MSMYPNLPICNLNRSDVPLNKILMEEYLIGEILMSMYPILVICNLNRSDAPHISCKKLQSMAAPSCTFSDTEQCFHRGDPYKSLSDKLFLSPSFGWSLLTIEQITITMNKITLKIWPLSWNLDFLYIIHEWNKKKFEGFTFIKLLKIYNINFF